MPPSEVAWTYQTGDMSHEADDDKMCGPCCQCHGETPSSRLHRFKWGERLYLELPDQLPATSH